MFDSLHSQNFISQNYRTIRSNPIHWRIHIQCLIQLTAIGMHLEKKGKQIWKWYGLHVDIVHCLINLRMMHYSFEHIAHYYQSYEHVTFPMQTIRLLERVN